MEKSFLTLTEAAHALGISYGTLRRYVRLGRIKAERPGEKRAKATLITASEIERVKREGVRP